MNPFNNNVNEKQNTKFLHSLLGTQKNKQTINQANEKFILVFFIILYSNLLTISPCLLNYYLIERIKYLLIFSLFIY